ncbi:hypothetical protein BpJC4_20400 [Weizmannia acidilactici]|nr:hypothetical protein BpJC4_20400 [Weizmannia acidilactici]
MKKGCPDRFEATPFPSFRRKIPLIKQHGLDPVSPVFSTVHRFCFGTYSKIFPLSKKSTNRVSHS